MKPIIIVTIISTLLAGSASAQDFRVEIRNHQFVPAQLTIHPGDKVTWINQDQDPHNVMDKTSPKAFHSAALDTSDTYSFIFAKAGKYGYFCTFHPTMTGSVTVAAGK